MFFSYLKVLGFGQRHQSCLLLGDLLFKLHPIVIYDGLVMDVHDVFCASSSSHHIRSALKLLLEFVVLLPIDTMYPLIISRKI